MLGVVASVSFFAVVTILLPSLRNRWGLLLFVPFAIIFNIGWQWFFRIHPENLARKLGDSTEERRRKFQLFLGGPR